MAKPTLPEIAAANLKRIVESNPILSALGNKALGGALDTSEGMAARLRAGEWNPTAATLEKVALKLDVEAWQLLIEGFDGNRKRWIVVSEEEFEAEVEERLKVALNIRSGSKGTQNHGQKSTDRPGVDQPFINHAHNAIRQVDFPDKYPPPEAADLGALGRKAAEPTKK